MPNSVTLPNQATSPHRVCPWWIGYLLASPLRKIFQNPKDLLAGHVLPGMTVLEPGPGMGFFTLELARRVGDSGRVIAVDIQPRMLKGLRRRAARAGLLDRVETRQAMPDSLCIDDLKAAVDFTLAVAVVHELPSAASFFREVAYTSKPGARVLLVEPKGHVPDRQFDEELWAARDAGFSAPQSQPSRGSHTVLLQRVGT